MDVTMVGTGSMARAIAARVLAGSHSVTLHGRTWGEAEALDEELVKLGLENHSVSAGVVGDETSGEVVVLAVSYDNVGDTKWTVTQLIEDAGLRAIDAGPLRRAQQLEALGYLHMAIQGELGTGFASALKILA